MRIHSHLPTAYGIPYRTAPGAAIRASLSLPASPSPPWIAWLEICQDERDSEKSENNGEKRAGTNGSGWDSEPQRLKNHKDQTHTKPNQTKPNQTKPNQTKPDQTRRYLHGHGHHIHDDKDEVLLLPPRHRRGVHAYYEYMY
jgi:hypothetical protein